MIGRLKMTMGKQLILWPCLPNGCCSQFIWITSNPILENPQYFPHWTCTHLKMSGGSARFLMSTYHSTVKATTVSSQKVLMTFQVQSTKMQYLRLFSTHPGIHKPLGMWIQPIPGYWGKVLGKGLPPLPICSWKKNSVPNVLYFKKLLQFLVILVSLSPSTRKWVANEIGQRWQPVNCLAQTVPGYKTATETSLILWATSPKWRNCKWPVRISKWSVVGINLTSQMENNSMVTLITMVTAGPSSNSGRSVTSTNTTFAATFSGWHLCCLKSISCITFLKFQMPFPWGRLLATLIALWSDPNAAAQKHNGTQHVSNWWLDPSASQFDKPTTQSLQNPRYIQWLLFLNKPRHFLGRCRTHPEKWPAFFSEMTTGW